MTERYILEAMRCVYLVKLHYAFQNAHKLYLVILLNNFIQRYVTIWQVENYFIFCGNIIDLEKKLHNSMLQK